MQLILDLKNIAASRDAGLAAGWTALIPAAGRGSRLNFDGPKLLYPVLGKPILSWLAERMSPLCRDFVFVLSPEGEARVRPVLNAALGPRARVALQNTPTGMADAIALGEPLIQTPYTLVIWGDQVTVRPETLAACMTALESSRSSLAVIPTIYRKNPYIHFIRDAEERIVQVYEARESDERLEQGENDCGVFLFRTEALFRILRKARGNPAFRGAKTGEENFLSMIPLFHQDRVGIVTVRIHDADETLGINTPVDAEQVSQILKGRQR